VTSQTQSESVLVYQMKVTLLDVRPLIWRRFQMASNQSFYDLHLTLQAVMGWENYHLYEFSFDLKDARAEKLGDWVHSERQILHYTYDFGDLWEHEVLVEKILNPKKGVKYPVCLKGNRACPPEDCGGPMGYMHMLRVIRNRKHPDYREMKDWLGDGYDPLVFDSREVNRELKELRKSMTKKAAKG
jgi:integrase/recombinase XerD